MHEPGDPMVVADYMFPAGRDGPAVLVARELRSGATMATVTPRKGDSDGWVVEKLAKWIDDLGHQKVVIKTDQEPSITALMRSVRGAREVGSSTIIEASAVGDPQSNGAAEQAVGEVKGMLRTIKANVERTTVRDTAEGRAMLTWRIEHAAMLCSRH